MIKISIENPDVRKAVASVVQLASMFRPDLELPAPGNDDQERDAPSAAEAAQPEPAAEEKPKRGRGRPKKVEPQPEPAAEAQDADDEIPDAEPVDDAPATATTHTAEQVREALRFVGRSISPDAAVGVLAAAGYQNVSSVPEAEYGALVAAFRKAVADAEGDVEAFDEVTGGA